jgi:lysophospholipase L1-like esterase
MKALTLPILTLLLGPSLLPAQNQPEPVDLNKARLLLQRQRAGEPLTTEEQAYLQRARELRSSGGRPAAAAGQRQAPERLIPLTDMAAGDRYEGEDGGLYGGGLNTPPEAHRQAARAQLAKIRPLNAAGEPDEDGTIGFVSISMSNATQEFSRFKQIADQSPLKSPRVTIVDCAQGGQAMAEWAPADARPWREALNRLARAKVSPQQVQVAWIKLANKAPTGSLQDHARKLEKDTLAVLHNARKLFPNLRLAYLGSRTYGGYATGGLNPEPYAYESAFAARWLIQRQIQGDPELALDKAPLLLWGPYLWAEGTKGRQVDSLVWNRHDFVGDGVHPSDSGRQKVAELLLHFLTSDPLAKPWFARP